MKNLWIEAQCLLMNMQKGDILDKYECIKRTPKKIYLKGGITIRYQYIDKDSFYLVSNKKVGNSRKKVDMVIQIIRDIEGWLIYKIHSKKL